MQPIDWASEKGRAPKGLILVGGKSTRLGQPKHRLGFHGKPQVSYLVEQFSEIGLDIRVSCNATQTEELKDYARVVDSFGDIGPLGGVLSAFQHDGTCPWLVVACDLPAVTARTFRRLLDAWTGDADVITVKGKDAAFPETTLSLYNPSIYPALYKAAHSGSYSLQHVLGEAKTQFVTPADLRELINVNTVKDLNELGLSEQGNLNDPSP